jgi:hypothetical protein
MLKKKSSFVDRRSCKGGTGPLAFATMTGQSLDQFQIMDDQILDSTYLRIMRETTWEFAAKRCTTSTEM